jgi:hypothetical protein
MLLVVEIAAVEPQRGGERRAHYSARYNGMRMEMLVDFDFTSTEVIALLSNVVVYPGTRKRSTSIAVVPALFRRYYSLALWGLAGTCICAIRNACADEFPGHTSETGGCAVTACLHRRSFEVMIQGLYVEPQDSKGDMSLQCGVPRSTHKCRQAISSRPRIIVFYK